MRQEEINRDFPHIVEHLEGIKKYLDKYSIEFNWTFELRELTTEERRTMDAAWKQWHSGGSYEDYFSVLNAVLTKND